MSTARQRGKEPAVQERQFTVSEMLSLAAAILAHLLYLLYLMWHITRQ
jgi:hypothetical protein